MDYALGNATGIAKKHSINKVSIVMTVVKFEIVANCAVCANISVAGGRRSAGRVYAQPVS